MRVSDINDLGDAAPNEEIVYCDLSKEYVYKLVKGCNGIVHFGGISMKNHGLQFALTLRAQSISTARKTGCKRIRSSARTIL